MSNLILYYFNECPYCQRVLDSIESLGIRNKIKFKNTHESHVFQRELISLTGKTQVPCLSIDGKPMLESSDIISYLEKNKSNLD